MAALTRLALTDFRNHAEALIAPGEGFVILAGENGAGKTNILEAVSLLTPGRGLRGATLSEMARSDGPGGFAISARLGSDVDLGTGTLATAPERRQVRINGADKSAAALGEWLSVLWLTPAMDRLFLESAGGRRRFLDRLVLAREPGHAAHSNRYEAATRARNKLLAEPDGADPAWLAALEAGMAEHGAAIAEARDRIVAALSERLATQPQGPFARAGITLTGWTPAAEDAQAALAAELRGGRGRDAAAGRALAGPHRSDLAVTHLDKTMPAELCSTGEQKALLLGIILAHADLIAEARGQRPILLLDEVAAHLDPSRRAALFARLAAAGGQSWMTGTEADLFRDVGTATRLMIGDGEIGTEM
ncbi:MAG TPA: DNA replication/repair protein RecF [Sphingomonas sp.]|uniref:DNA replication/repair protein RecF n=1 Tax=Sphingomonas sp. TaxID=28214 RepID=UPI002BAD93DC|nr:DNA replication/repair protein RecF [Sphingomonas sp.]HMI18920.1 DNA replication/repair protein RecF [Sphingomonas sp.]